MTTITHIARFIRRHYAPVRTWPRGRLLEWLRWYVYHDCVAVTTARGRLSSVCLVRRVHSVCDAGECYAHDESGHLAYVDLCVARRPTDVQMLVVNLLNLVASCTHVAYERALKNRVCHVFPIKHFLKTLKVNQKI